MDALAFSPARAAVTSDFDLENCSRIFAYLLIYRHYITKLYSFCILCTK